MQVDVMLFPLQISVFCHGSRLVGDLALTLREKNLLSLFISLGHLHVAPVPFLSGFLKGTNQILSRAS